MARRYSSRRKVLLERVGEIMRANFPLVELIDSAGVSWGYAELSPAKITKLVRAYKSAGIFLEARLNNGVAL